MGVTEKQLLDALGRVPACLDAVGLLLVVLYSDGRVAAVNETACHVLDRKRSDIIDSEWLGFIPSSSHEDARYVFKKTSDGDCEHLERYEAAVLTPTGDSRTIEWSNSELRDGKGPIIGIVQIGRDVTDQTAALEALRESEQRHRTLIENVPVGIFRASPGGRPLMANAKMLSMLRCESFAELATKNIAEIYHPDTPRSIFVERMEEHGEVIGLETIWIAMDGTEVAVRQNARSVTDGNGNTVYYEGTVEDITARKRAEKVLSNQMEFEKLVVGISGEFISLGSDDLDSRIESALRQLCEFMGVDRAYLYQNLDGGEDDAFVAYEWAASGIDSKGDELGDMNIDMFPWCADQLRNGQVVHIPSVDDMPAEASAAKRQFEAEDVQSAVIVPLRCREKLMGLVGFDSIWRSRCWEDHEISMLKVVGELVANALERKRVEEELRYRFEFDEIITSILTKFVHLKSEEVDEAIDDALRELGDFMMVDLCMVCHYGLEQKALLSSAVWLSEDSAESVSDSEIPSSICGTSWVMKAVKKKETVNIPDVSMLKTKSRRVSMEKLGISSLLCVPCVCREDDVVFMCLASQSSDKGWTDDFVSLIRTLGEIFASAITQKESDTGLALERMLTNALMDHLPVSIYFKDKDSRFLRVNRALAQKHGRATPEEHVGKTDFDVFTKEHAQQAFEDEQRIMETGEPMLDLEEKETWPDGSETWVSTTKLPLYDASGQVVGTFGISRDITARKNAEEEQAKLEVQMLQMQKLESLGMLSGGIAHDFNNLLMGIMGHANLALMDLTPNSTAWDSIKQIETVALRAAELTNQLLAYSGKSKSVTVDTDLTELVREMASLLEVSVGSKAELVCELDDAVPPILCDPVQIRQVVLNLITNASDALVGQRGKITIKTGILDCDHSYLAGCFVDANLEPGKRVFVEVSDTGSGMDEETKEKIFDPFFTTKPTGHGLGLAAVLGIVRAHKAALKVYSELGKGTLFRILFPCSVATEGRQKDKAKNSKKSWRGEGMVLVADDDDVVAGVARQILERLGFKVAVAVTGKEAVARVAAELDLSAILLDVTMPGGGCKDVMSRIRKMDKNIPIILMSGYSRESATSGIDATVYNGFLQKPFSSDELASVLRDATAG